MAYPYTLDAPPTLEDGGITNELEEPSKLHLVAEHSTQETRAQVWKCVISGLSIERPNCIPSNKDTYDGVSTSIGMVHKTKIHFYKRALKEALEQLKDRDSANLRLKIIEIVMDLLKHDRQRMKNIFD